MAAIRALTYVGLVPASLIGIDIDALLDAAAQMLEACRAPHATPQPGRSLGLAIGSLAKAGRDKLTFLADPAISSFGAWAEQLLADRPASTAPASCRSTSSRSGTSTAYGADRVFVDLALAGGDAGRRAGASPTASRRPAIRSSGSSSTTRSTSPARCVRWEVATAFAGAVLGIDPFDQPNVEEAKELTRRVLAAHADGGETTESRDPGAILLRAHDESRSRVLAPDASTRPRACRATSPSRRSSPRPRRSTSAIAADPRGARDATAARRPPAMARASCTRPASCTRAAPPIGRVPAAYRRPPGRSGDPGLAVHVRPADRRPGARATARRCGRMIDRSSTSTSATTCATTWPLLERAVRRALS